MMVSKEARAGRVGRVAKILNLHRAFSQLQILAAACSMQGSGSSKQAGRRQHVCEHNHVHLVNHIACHKSVSSSVTSQASAVSAVFTSYLGMQLQQYLVFFLSLLTNHLFTSRIWF